MSALAVISLQQTYMDSSAASEGLVHASAEEKFKEIFTAYYEQLRQYAWSIVRDEVIAEETVQTVFCRLWESPDHIQLHKANKPYLYKAVYNESINHLKTTKSRLHNQAQMIMATDVVAEDTDRTDLRTLNEKAAHALNQLPSQCRTIFQLSRMEGLKYREIAAQLNISVKTVETQMSKALRQLRTSLADYLPLLCLYLLTCKN